MRIVGTEASYVDWQDAVCVALSGPCIQPAWVADTVGQGVPRIILFLNDQSPSSSRHISRVTLSMPFLWRATQLLKLNGN